MQKTVLIVEDNELNMKLFNDLVETRGCRIVQTRNGVEAVELARRHRPDLILMDIQLPEVSGLEVTQWLKDDETLRSIPVIAVTAFAMKGDEEKSGKAGARLIYRSRFPWPNSSRRSTTSWEPSEAMTARILVVDDNPANRKLLEARLNAEYFDVLTTSNGPDALQMCEKSLCDIVLLDVMMPDMDGFEVCRRLKSHVSTAHLPVVLVTALDQPADRVRGLEAGADDFVTKPIDEMQLIARVRSLARLKVVIDELRNRANTTVALGMIAPYATPNAEDGRRGRLLLVDDRKSSSERLVNALSPHHAVTLEANAQEAMFKAAEDNVDVIIISLGLAGYDALRLCSQIRALERTRNLPILVIADLEDRQRVLRGLELGINDWLSRPVDRNELLARVRTQLRQKRYADSLREKVQQSIELALFDPLTGLNNRRFLESHLATMLENARMRRAALTLMILDIDHFKRVNDTHGHDAGDEVLKGFADRLRGIIRGGDLLCRLGGEEFVIVMPGVDLVAATRIAERARQAIEQEAFPVDNSGLAINITASIGVAERREGNDPHQLYRRADQALYRSKAEGRNRVSADAA